mmetsp:Transcript_777/g.930  ORF Transcript_777/g.930 Transcript_777/m.930 type:complete len:506 (+) Transcript_777:89-1606(+)
MLLLKKPFLKCGISNRMHRRLFSSYQAILSLDSEVLRPPSSVHKVSTGYKAGAGNGGVSIREVGCTRRVFILEPHQTIEEIEGMAYRIRVLSKNKGINSVLISRGNSVDVGLLPTSVVDRPVGNPEDEIIGSIEGYDPVELYKSGLYKDENRLDQLFDAVGNLCTAVRGDAEESRIPILTLPPGLICDAGYALCMGGYVLATDNTSFRIVNPSRGLSFDPIGLSFILPRLGWEFQQKSAEFVGCGMILALTGMEAKVHDMMKTGLATHYIESSTKLSVLERSLADLLSWDQQGIRKPRPQIHGRPKSEDDASEEYRNVGVAYLVDSFTSYNNMADDIYNFSDFASMGRDDPSVDLDYISFDEFRKSNLLQYAEMLDSIFREENTVVGIFERLKEMANHQSIDDDYVEVIAVAKQLVQKMERQSPLAISVIHKLMQAGGKKDQSITSCMEREKSALKKLYNMEDFQNWAKHEISSSKKDSFFSDWKYKTLNEVPADEVNEIIGLKS